MSLAVARYLASDVVRSQRFLAPVLLFGATLAVLFSGDPGAPPAPWAASALVSYPVAAWLAFVVANTEDPVQQAVTAVAAGWRRVFSGVLLTALAADLGLVALAVAWPVVATPYDYGWSVVWSGVMAHLACATTGTAVGVLCARPVMRRIGWSLCLGAGLVLVTALQPWLPPVGDAVAALSSPPAAPGRLAADAALGTCLAIAATAVAIAVARRR